MIESELITLIHSEVVSNILFSDDDPDFRYLDLDFRLLEDGQQRDLENDEKRILE